jgi:hypothetical protein
MSFISNIVVGNSSSVLTDIKAEKEQLLQQKRELLTPTVQEDLSKSSVLMDDGTIESNANKVWNDLSREELAGVASSTFSSDALGRREDGSLYNLATGQDYNGKASYFYAYGNKLDDESLKIGIARGDLPNADYRYQPGRAAEEGYKVGKNGYGYASGEYGVDTDKKLVEVLLPDSSAKILEGLYHGNTGNLEDRLYKSDRKDIGNLLGGGKTEYYNSRDVLLGQGDSSKYIGTDKAKELFDSYRTKVYGKIEPEKSLAERKYDYMSGTDKVVNAAMGVAPSIVKGAVDLADAALELATYPIQETISVFTGDDKFDIDLIDDEYKKKGQDWVDRALGYDREMTNIAGNRALEEVKASGIDITSWDSIEQALTDPAKSAKLLAATKIALYNPALVSDSLAEMVGSGLALKIAVRAGAAMMGKYAPELADKLGTVFNTNKGKIAESISKVNASDISKAEKVVAVKELENSYTFSKKLPDLLRGTSFTNADVMVRTNNDLTEFEQNNGAPATPEKVLEVVTLNKIASEINMAVDKGALKIDDLVGIGGKEVFNNVAKQAWDTTKHILGSTVAEGVQETFDSIVEQVNQNLGSKPYEDRNVLDVLKDKSAEIVTGTILGAVGGGQMAAASELGTVSSGAGTVASKAVEAAGKVVNAGKEAYSEMVGTAEDNTLTSAREVITRAATTPTVVTPKVSDSTISTEPVGEELAARLAAVRAQIAAGKFGKGVNTQDTNKSAVDTVTTILGSSENALNRFKQFGLDLEDVAAEIMATDDQEAVNEVTSVIANKVKGTPEGDAVYDEWLARVTEKSKAIKVLNKLENATGKSQEQVTEEAVIGDIGFLSHYNAAKITNASGDLDSRNRYTASLDRMRNNAQTKLDSFEGAVVDAVGTIQAKFIQANPNAVWANADKTLTAEAKSFLENYVKAEEAKQKKNTDAGKTVERLESTKVNYQTFNVDGSIGESQEFRLNNYLAAKDLLSRDGDKRYEVRSKGAGAFRLVNQVQEELGAMNVLYGSLIKEFSGEVGNLPTQAASSEAGPVVTPTATPTQDLNEIAKQADTFENDLPISNQANSDMEPELVTDGELDNIWGSYPDSGIDNVPTTEWEPEFTEPPNDPSRRVENFGRVTASYGTKVDALGNEVVNTAKGFKDVRVTLEIAPGRIENAGSDDNVTKYRIIGKEAFKDVLTGLAQADEASGDTRSIDWLQGHMNELDMMLEVIGDVEFTVGIIKPKKDGSSSYNLNTGEVTLRANSTEYSTSGTLLRELVNKLTYRGLEVNPELKSRVNKLREMVIDRIPEQDRDKVREYAKRFANQEEGVFNDMVAEGLDKYYGLLNDHELMTETVSNPEFRNVLMNISTGAFEKVYMLVSQLVRALFGKSNEGVVLNALDDARELLGEALVATKQLEDGKGFTKVSGLMVDAVTRAKAKKDIDRKTANGIMDKIKNINPTLAAKVKANMAIAESENYNIAESGSMTTLEALKLAIIQEFKTIGEC